MIIIERRGEMNDQGPMQIEFPSVYVDTRDNEVVIEAHGGDFARPGMNPNNLSRYAYNIRLSVADALDILGGIKIGDQFLQLTKKDADRRS